MQSAAAVIPIDRTDRPGRRGSRFGEYNIVMPLARGGMGGVYLATHDETGDEVALKILDPQFANHPEVVDRLFAEQRLASAARHPGLVDIRSARRASDGIPYLVMEYLDGETLADAAETGSLDLSAILSIAAQVAAALAALHAAGVMHCDVKPENIFITGEARNPRVKLIDFGVSRHATEPQSDDVTIAGTPWCMAPEQWHGRPTFASDVYALGCVLYDLTTGFPPFDGSLPELMLKHLEQRPARPSWLAKLPLELERVILRALAKDPDLRPTMAELAHELATLADASSPELRAAG